ARGRAGRELVDEQALTGKRATADELDGKIVAADAILDVRAGVEDGGEPTVHVIEVEVGRRVAGGEVIVLGPDEEGRVPAAEFHQDRVAAVAEVVQVRAGEGSRVRGGAGQEVALPGAGGQIVGVSLVAGRGKVENAAARHRVDRLGHGPVLERRLVEVDDVVDDDVAAVGGQGDDICRECRLVGGGGRETERRSGSEVV